MEVKLPTLKKVNPNKVKKKKILLLSDDLRLFSGIGTMSRAIVMGSMHKYDWAQIGGAVNHPDNGKIFDMSKDAAKESGVEDAYCKIYPVNGYGNQVLLRQVIAIEKPDIIMHFTDPRFWDWLYEMAHEIRQEMPLIYLNIWDDLPYPHWNENAYESCDLLMAISKQTYNINKNVCQRKPRTDWDLTYVQHGICKETHKPLSESALTPVKKELFRNKEYDFVAFYNSRNIRRKSTSDLMLAYRIFCDNLTKEQADRCLLLLHTNEVDDAGTNLPEVRDRLCGGHNVLFSPQKIDSEKLNMLYNIADITCQPSSAEGFGLSVMESIMSGTMILGTAIGGIQDQMGFVKDDGSPVLLEDFTTDWPSNSNMRYTECGEWALPVWPQINLQGSPATPYIYDSRPNIKDIASRLMEAYKLGRDERKRRGKVGREWAIGNGFDRLGMCKAFVDSVEGCLENWKPIQRWSMIDTSKPKPNYPDGIIFDTLIGEKI